MRLAAAALVAQLCLAAQSSALRALSVSPSGVIVDDSGSPVQLLGLNRSGTGSGNAEANSTDQEYAAQNQLLPTMNLIRIFVNAAWWNSNLPVPIAGMNYQDYIDSLIQRAEKYGNYVLIVKAGQFPDPPCGADGKNCPAPNQGDLNCQNNSSLCLAEDTTGTSIDAAFAFWDAFAQRYASDAAILYDTWEDMRGIDGGTWADNQNALIATIRTYSPQALIFVEDMGAEFDAIAAGTLADFAWPNLVWNFHIFNASSGSCTEPATSRYANWPQNFDPLVQFARQNGHAIAISEWGGCNATEPYHSNLVSYAQNHPMALVYSDSGSVIAPQADGTFQLTSAGARLAQAYMALSCTSCNADESVQFVSGSTTPLIQLTGETFQIQSNGIYFTHPTPGQTLTTSGALGTDLAFPVTLPERIVFLFGDTTGAYLNGTKYIQSPVGGPNNADDSMGFIPNADLSQCHYIGDVDQQLQKGVKTPATGFGGCPALHFFANPAHPATQHIFKSIVISGLQTGEAQGPFKVPTGGVLYNNRLYMFYITKVQQVPNNTQPPFNLQSILAKSDQAPSTWSDTNPPTFTRLSTVSTHAPVADPAHPPSETIGKFMFNTPIVVDSGTLSNAGLTASLPPALQGAASVVFVYGASFLYSTSNLFLAAFAHSDIEAGASKWFYYAGNGQWSKNESDAAPLLAPGVHAGTHSVIWNSTLQHFVLLHSPGVVAQFSVTPWGPWTNPAPILAADDSWGKKLLHHPGKDSIVRSSIPIYDANGNLVDLQNDVAGALYSPNLLDKFTQNADGSVTLYFTVSTWNPYEAFVVSAAFALVPPQDRESVRTKHGAPVR